MSLYAACSTSVLAYFSTANLKINTRLGARGGGLAGWLNFWRLPRQMCQVVATELARADQPRHFNGVNGLPLHRKHSRPSTSTHPPTQPPPLVCMFICSCVCVLRDICTCDALVLLIWMCICVYLCLCVYVQAAHVTTDKSAKIPTKE